ncbi:hypothetical protein BUALT_Bualt15G0134900 [Buddleja alternifolia]|uniref:Uncharacterized protein n=1 Tax=Buddleja alternifolia TaxID=168488 RepID=A0AAV6WGU3_9LAMI|nr:hypothetical protein BUALT_Bualt15G0134900 [Buddleja alternifolia]
MINTERNGNGVGSGGTGAPAHDKQLPGPIKKTALRDVQNENVGSIPKQQESLLPGGGRSSGDTIKVCGTKRLTPERPSSSQGFPSMAYNGTNENVMNARRRFELELGRGRLQNSVEKYSDCPESKNKGQLQHGIAKKITPMRDGIVHHVPVITSKNITPIMSFSSSGPSIPSSFAKPNYSTPATKVSPEIPHTVDSKGTNDQLRTERFIRLQKFLKQCDDANQRDYIQMLLHLHPDELSNHAYELEKRAIQLTIEEGSEMKRMRELNILAKSSPVNNSLHSTLSLQSNKRFEICKFQILCRFEYANSTVKKKLELYQVNDFPCKKIEMPEGIQVFPCNNLNSTRFETLNPDFGMSEGIWTLNLFHDFVFTE